METSLLDKMLSTYRTDKTTVTIVLQNKVRITGRISMFDSYVILLEDQKQGMIYRHAVSSIAPAAGGCLSGPREHKSVQTRSAPRQPAKADKQASHAPSRSKQARSGEEPRTAPPASGINTGMKEGLLRWMQEQKVGK